MIEVQVENFQSIEKAAFKIDGFTALVGRSNIGKSALVRAFRNALTGAPGTDFVRHGPSCERRLKDTKKCKCQTTVRILTAALELVWEKGDAVNRYTVTRPGQAPVLYDKVDRGTPDFLRPEFSPVKIGEDQELIQVSEQFSPIFLLDRSGPTVADVLSDVARLDDINEATRLVVKDRKEASATRTVRERDVADLAKQLVAYEGLDLLAEDVRRIESKHAQVQAKEREVVNAKRLVGELEALVKAIRGLQAATAPQTPDHAKVQLAGERLLKLVRFHDDWTNRDAEIDRLIGVEAVVLPDIDRLAATQKNFGRLDSWIRKLQGLKGDYERLQALGKVAEPQLDPLVGTAERLKLVDGLYNRFQAISGAVLTLQSQTTAAEQEEAQVLAELQELGLCPTCAQPFVPERHEHAEAP